jgi:hypothetical protein
MDEHQKIFLYGNSVILGSIGASLRRYSRFDVTTLAMPIQDELRFDDPVPGILLFDVEAPHSEEVFFLLKAYPALLLIGINPGANIIQVWRSQQIRGISMKGLIELLNCTDFHHSGE